MFNKLVRLIRFFYESINYYYFFICLIILQKKLISYSINSKIQYLIIYKFEFITKILGFYRVNYDTMNWLKIADYLNSENYTKIHVLNRARIIDDAIHLMFTDKLDPRIFMDLTKYLRRETDYTVWFSLFKFLEYTNNYFAYNGGGELLKVNYNITYHKIQKSLKNLCKNY